MTEMDGDIDAVRDWVQRAVIGHDLCPFAAGATAGTRYRSVEGDDAAVLGAFLDEALALHERREERPQTTLLVLSTPRDFDAFWELVGGADALLDRVGLRGRLQLAHFHPDYRFDGLDPDDPANWTNRAPRPVLHLLREQDVDVAVQRHPDPEGIPARNIRRLRDLGDPRAALWSDVGDGGRAQHRADARANAEEDHARDDHPGGVRQADQVDRGQEQEGNGETDR